MRLDDTEKAEKMFKNAIAIDDSFSNAHFNLSLVYAKLDKHLEAVKCLEKALELDPKNG